MGLGIEFTPLFWSGLMQIILVNIVLSGDNALVIALACRNLEKRHQKPAILIGSAGAIILRIIFVLIIDQLLKIGYLKELDTIRNIFRIKTTLSPNSGSGYI